MYAGLGNQAVKSLGPVLVKVAADRPLGQSCLTTDPFLAQFEFSFVQIVRKKRG